MTPPQGWWEVYETPYGWVAMAGGRMTDEFKTREDALEKCLKNLAGVLESYSREFGDLS